MILGKTFFNLEAMTFDIIFVSTFNREIGRQFSNKVRSLPFFFNESNYSLLLRA